MLPYTQNPPFYGQWGEDRWLTENLRLPETGVFVDVGAGDGVRGSNTLHFENRGWRGLCIDADPRNREPLRRNRRCLIDNRAISGLPGPQEFGLFLPRSSRSGLSRSGPGYDTMTVECVRLDALLDQMGITKIDLMSIDVEGTELDVWQSFDPDRNRPAVVIIEYDETHAARSEASIGNALGTAYELLHRTPANLLFQRTSP